MEPVHQMPWEGDTWVLHLLKGFQGWVSLLTPLAERRQGIGQGQADQLRLAHDRLTQIVNTILSRTEV